MKILIVEDEKKLAELVENRLVKEGYAVDVALDGGDGWYMARKGIYELIILDIMLPYKDGLTILKELREENINTPVIMMTARDGIEDKLEGFRKGISDYITKPFHLEELVARANNILKKDEQKNGKLEFGDIELDLEKKVLINAVTGESIEVMKKEYLLLECLMKNSSRIVSKDYIYYYVWGFDDNESSSLEVYVSFVRRKLKAIGTKTIIRVARGLGYKLEMSESE